MDLGFLIGLSLALGLAAWLFFLWSVKSGQYEDPEGPKYRMLEDDPEEAPGRAKQDAESSERASGPPPRARR
ncbi:cbb3-type cytochrome oxidase assembly protein CcoS [Anaeromyxobacter diazotrophicus]|uniref:Cytochrome oxidase maturation protein, cbb3-type n=1 Tax=Anaeromyxobacter diazotrophicus TaxID=2590199 RepID=A0A7I9VKA9_9BACT|nr:cbb3-type cytochrome oxidase assembly protein CcoS [Anaeromyxobacter diazotrophicus]GEJ56821.1 hypothetical protein AMYX_15620 [Anaeromyxobacter diazotrophicus]